MESKTLGRWRTIKEIGSGGNGIVFQAQCGKEQVALKTLKQHSRIGRFRDEIDGMKSLAHIEGVLPLIDSYVPRKPSDNNPAWFAMPIATPLKKALGSKPHPLLVVTAIRDIALVLANIHACGFSHRDIKPENLFKLNNAWSVGDFGLVEFESKTSVTAEGEKIGPLHYIAPEMLLCLPIRDGKAADVFSLAKTLWVLLTGQKYPLPGPYDASSIIHPLRLYVALERSISLDKLIQHCTVSNPADRPSMNEVVIELTSWIDLRNPNTSKLHAYEPVTTEWRCLIEASECESLALKNREELAAETNASVQRMADALREFYTEVIEDLSVLGLSQLVNVDGVYPPGISLLFPLKSSHENRLAMEFRVWLVADWNNLEKKKVNAHGLCKIKYGQTGRAKELYRIDDNFLIDSPGSIAFIEKVKSEVRNSIHDWLTLCANEWYMLP